MHTKASLPISILDGKNTLPIIEAYFEFNHLKQLYRQGWLQHGIEPKYCESVAEHSFCVALLGLLLADQYPELDVNKVVRMALIHDLGEIYAGDFTPKDKIDKNHKFELEKKSVLQVFNKLPNGWKWINLWEEYEQGISAEANFVQQLDRLEMLLQASIYEQQRQVDLSDFFASTGWDVFSPELQSIFQFLEDLRKGSKVSLSK
ncbi:HD domain-containing protein [Mastigocoleus sp. MO_188.B34]|uniref:HD domain-containing protein n=1 Tax=Mastigocoleus sp. MO_188.B34 TaxID=3036635 RepID=UPI002635C200|nr:HD domain-containing protein [Mastigocoleus sp. MO_188.B34]MDJ0693521.1 HD domain-containing protein [Mastigocoleus sp. MO_188.B34]